MVRPHGGVRVLPGGRGRVTAGAGGASPPGQSGDAKARIAAPRAAGKVPEEVDAVIGILSTLIGILITLLPERTARKTGADSGLPPWRTDRDGAARRGGGDSGRGAKPDLKAGGGLRRAAFGDMAAAGIAAPRMFSEPGMVFGGGCGKDSRACLRKTTGLPAAAFSGCSRSGTAAAMHGGCGAGPDPRRAGRTGGTPDRPGGSVPQRGRPVLPPSPGSWMDAGSGNRTVAGTGAGDHGRRGRRNRRRQGRPQHSRQRQGRRRRQRCGRLPQGRPPDGGGWRGAGRGGGHGPDAPGAVPERARQPCGSRLLGETAFVAGSSGLRQARLMGKLPRGLCRSAGRSGSRVLAEAGRRAARRRYRTVLTQGGKELPGIPPGPEGRRGRTAKSGGRSLHERPAKRGESVLRFMRGPDAGFTDNEGGRKIRMAKVRIKVSGRFRTRLHAEAWRRIPSHPDSMAAPGCNSLAAIRTAPAGNAAGMIRLHRAQSSATKG